MANIKAIPGGATTPKGFSAAAVYTAIKKRENQKPDVAILYSELPCSCAACFWSSDCRSSDLQTFSFSA